MNTNITFLLAFLLITATLSLSLATRPEPSKGKPQKTDKGAGNYGDPGGFFGPGSGFDIPGFGNDWGSGRNGGGYGYGFGGPKGGYNKGGVTRPTMVCREKGPCYKKKLTCPAKCFTSYSRSGKGGGGGGGGGGCSMDCKKKCIAYC